MGPAAVTTYIFSLVNSLGYQAGVFSYDKSLVKVTSIRGSVQFSFRPSLYCYTKQDRGYTPTGTSASSKDHIRGLRELAENREKRIEIKSSMKVNLLEEHTLAARSLPTL